MKLLFYLSLYANKFPLRVFKYNQFQHIFTEYNILKWYKFAKQKNNSVTCKQQMMITLNNTPCYKRHQPFQSYQFSYVVQ